jgi:pimeloyl-ACP methyl ester carboxylesterase
VVAFAPAGGWALGDESYRETLAAQAELLELMKRVAPLAGGDDLIAHQMLGVAAAPMAGEMLEHALREGWTIEPERITGPVRIVWGSEDRLLPWPRAAARYREQLAHADWIPSTASATRRSSTSLSRRPSLSWA